MMFPGTSAPLSILLKDMYSVSCFSNHLEHPDCQDFLNATESALATTSAN